MAKHTQAHISRKVRNGMSAMTQRQVEYYMGAKLIEVGIDPKSAVYRWTVKKEDGQEVWTYSAYWGDSREKIEAGETP